MRISDWSSDVCSSDLITISWSLFAEGIPRHDKCALLGGDPKGPQHLSFVGNLCAHNGDRNPDVTSGRAPVSRSSTIYFTMPSHNLPKFGKAMAGHRFLWWALSCARGQAPNRKSTL